MGVAVVFAARRTVVGLKGAESSFLLVHRVHRVESQLGVSPANIDTGEAGGGYLRQRVTKIACGHFGWVRVIFGRANTA